MRNVRVGGTLNNNWKKVRDEMKCERADGSEGRPGQTNGGSRDGMWKGLKGSRKVWERDKA